MKTNINIIPFRVFIAKATTLATAPLVVSLASMQARLLQINMWSSAVPDMTKSGWQLYNKGQLILPSNAAGEAGITFGVGEVGWNPIPASRVDIDLYDFRLDEISSLEFHFYNTSSADIAVGGFIQSRDPVPGLDALVSELARLRVLYENINHGFPEHAH